MAKIRRRRPPAWTALTALLTAALAAQEPTPAPERTQPPPTAQPQAQPPQGGSGPRLLVDRVVATVSDAAILESDLRTASAGRFRVLQPQLGRPLQPAERARVIETELEALIDNHAMAQAARNLGILPPERVEQIFREQLRQEEREQEKDFGSLQEFSRALAQQGRTWQTFYRDQRVQKMAQLAEEMTVYSRLQNQQNLFLTPRMMWDYYQENKAIYVHGAAAALAQVVFVGNDAPHAAKAAAAAWAKETWTAAELAQRFEAQGARALPDPPLVVEGERSSLPPEVVQFALQGPLGAVSEPMGAGNARIYKVMGYSPARNDAFDAPGVQDDIRTRLQRLVVDSLMQQAKTRARQRTHTWYAPLR